jgi:hypothetical protein
MRNEAVAALLVMAVVVGAGAGYFAGYANERTVTSVSTFITTSTNTTTFFSTVLKTTTTTTTVTTTVPSEYPITFLGTPKGCSPLGPFCVNSTLVNHLGSNISVAMLAWFRNATTGQNVTTLGKNSVDAAGCTVDARRPSTCLIVDFLLSGTYEVTLTVLGLDVKTALSPAITFNVSN